MTAVRHAVRTDLANLAAGDRVLVACSGGADSAALALALSKEAPLMAISLAAVTVDHGLQEESAMRAAQTAEWLQEIGYEQTSVVKVAVGTQGGLEAAARDARYSALISEAERCQALAIYLGHSMDDQAESVLLGLGRGSGPRSIAGMERVNDIYHRPLLGLRRSELRGACIEQNVPIWDDPHNNDERFTRVRIRNLMPSLDQALGGGLVEALARTADLVREDLAALDALAQPYAAREQVQAEELAGLPAALRTRALRAMALHAGVPAGSLTFDHLTRMAALITSWKGQGGVALPAGLTFGRKSGRLSFSTTRKVERESH